MMVEDHRWLSEREFVDILALCQLLPGPNIVNVTIAVGARFHGAVGAVVAFTGLMIVPVTLMVVLGTLYVRYGQAAALRGPLSGIAAVAAGLVLAMALRMGTTLRGRHEALLVAAVTFVAAGVARWPLGWIVLGIAPVSVALAAATRAAGRRR
jgi:chromate transporter